MDTYVFGGILLMMPVHATVMIFGFSIVPHETIVGGTGARSVPAFHIVLLKSITFMLNNIAILSHNRSISQRDKKT